MEIPPLLSLEGDLVTVKWIKTYEFRLIWVIFGSANSTDIDVMFWIPLELTKENPHIYTIMCHYLDKASKECLEKYGVDVTRPINSCLGYWTEDSVLRWVMKGSISEANNSIVATWKNHPQMTKKCEFVSMPRTPDDVRVKVLGAMRMITNSMADASYAIHKNEPPEVSILFHLLKKILAAPEIATLSDVEKHNMRQILFQIPELKSFMTKRCKFLPTREVDRIKELKKQMKLLTFEDLDAFENIYNEAKTITESLIAIILADYNNHNTAALKPEYIGAMNGDFQGSLFTMHRISRLITRMRYAFFQTTFLKNVDCMNIIIAAPESIVEVWKKIAFQIGQTLALLEGEELFEKQLIVEKYPDLARFLTRQPSTPNNRLGIMILFREFVRKIYKRGIIVRMDTELQYRTYV